MMYYALDFVNSEECELVYDCQLYTSWEAAASARAGMRRPECFDITPYRVIDLEDVFGGPVTINDDLTVEC
jgi:hypothetical protein